MIDQWKTFLSERVAQWHLPGGGEWTFIFSNNYQPNYSTLALLWFHNRTQFPHAVTKLFREPRIPKREFENLQYVYSRVPHYVPRPLHFGPQGEYWTLWMEGVPGFPLERLDAQASADLRSIVELLTSIHMAVREIGHAADPDRYRRVVSEPLKTLKQFGTSSSVQDECARIAAATSIEWFNSLPVVPQHGDLVRSNILSSRDRWYIIDWESFGIIDLPFYDLSTFLFSLLIRGADMPDRFDPGLAKQTLSLTQYYAQQLGLCREDISRLFPLALANWFHLQWLDGRKEFANRLYKGIEHFIEHRELWDAILCS